MLDARVESDEDIVVAAGLPLGYQRVGELGVCLLWCGDKLRNRRSVGVVTAKRSHTSMPIVLRNDSTGTFSNTTSLNFANLWNSPPPNTRSLGYIVLLATLALNTSFQPTTCEIHQPPFARRTILCRLQMLHHGEAKVFELARVGI